METRQFSLVREEARRAWRELRGDGLSPASGALAVAIGLFIGSQPIFGLHTPLVLALCLWFRLDAAIAWVASNVSNPFFAAPLVTAEVRLGEYLRTGTHGDAARDFGSFGWHGAFALKGFVGSWFLGALVLGGALALVGGVLTFATLHVRRRSAPRRFGEPPSIYELPANAPPWIVAVEKVARRYAPPEHATPAERTRFHYVRLKLLSDPVARMVADLEAERDRSLGDVLDIGSGAGQLSLLLLELRRASSVRGIDWDRSKIDDAVRATRPSLHTSALENAEFSVGDARTSDYGEADTVLLIDVLHYFSIGEQDAILARAARAVRPGGRVIVREADADRGWRSRVTWLEERIFTALRFNRGERVRFRSSREIESQLTSAGLSCHTRPAWGKTPFSNVLIVSKRAPLLPVP